MGRVSSLVHTSRGKARYTQAAQAGNHRPGSAPQGSAAWSLKPGAGGGTGRVRGGDAQSKWGRHRCRPHSHQRVGAPGLRVRPASRSSALLEERTWRPMSMPVAFAFRRSPGGGWLGLRRTPERALSPRLASSPALAPASGCAWASLPPPPGSCDPCSGAPPAFREAETAIPDVFPISNGRCRVAPSMRPRSRTRVRSLRTLP
jgi:hypothetical protein